MSVASSEIFSLMLSRRRLSTALCDSRRRRRFSFAIAALLIRVRQFDTVARVVHGCTSFANSQFHFAVARPSPRKKKRKERKKKFNNRPKVSTSLRHKNSRKDLIRTASRPCLPGGSRPRRPSVCPRRWASRGCPASRPWARRRARRSRRSYRP